VCLHGHGSRSSQDSWSLLLRWPTCDVVVAGRLGYPVLAVGRRPQGQFTESLGVLTSWVLVLPWLKPLCLLVSEASHGVLRHV
jgi:hypothetical protein